jgi:hypothetical protein
VYFYENGYLSRIIVGARPTKQRVLAFPPSASNFLTFAVGRRYVFWTALADQAPGAASGTSTLFRATLRGTHAVALVRHLVFPMDLTLLGNRVYWTDQTAIGRANFDGSHVERRLATPSQEYGGGVADGLTSDGHYLYFARCQTGSIGRVLLNGKTLDERFIVFRKRSCPQNLAHSNGYLYFTNSLDSIGRVSLTEPQKINLTWLRVSADSIAVDSRNIFWTIGGATGGVIGRASSNGRIINDRLTYTRQGVQIVMGPA